MYFTGYLYGTIKVTEGEVQNDGGLVWEDKKGIELYNDNGKLLLLSNSATKIFIITKYGYTYDGCFADFKDNKIVLDDKMSFDINKIVFIGISGS